MACQKMKMASDTLRRRHCKKIGEEDMDVGQAGGDVGEFNASQVGGEGTTTLVRLGYRRDDFNWLIFTPSTCVKL